MLPPAQSLDDEDLANELKETLGDWYDRWKVYLGDSTENMKLATALMKTNNPVVIPRNHHVERVLTACEETGNTQAADDFLTVLRSPYNELANTINYQDVPMDEDRNYRTFCGT